MSLGICTIIVVAVYLVSELLKVKVLKTDDKRAYLPYFGLVFGALLGFGVFSYDPTMIEATNALEAILVGAGSGLIATGGNQLFKQTNKLMKGDFKGLNDGLDEVLEMAEDMKKELDEEKKSDSNTQ